MLVTRNINRDSRGGELDFSGGRWRHDLHGRRRRILELEVEVVDGASARPVREEEEDAQQDCRGEQRCHAQLPVSHPFRKRGLHAESLVRTALEASRVRPRFARAPCGARVRTSGAVSAADCEQGGTCSPLGAATFPP